MKRTPFSPEGRRNRHPHLPNLSFCQGLANTGLPNPQLQLSEGNKGYTKFNKRLGGITSSGHFQMGGYLVAVSQTPSVYWPSTKLTHSMTVGPGRFPMFVTPRWCAETCRSPPTPPQRNRKHQPLSMHSSSEPGQRQNTLPCVIKSPEGCSSLVFF